MANAIHVYRSLFESTPYARVIPISRCALRRRPRGAGAIDRRACNRRVFLGRLQHHQPGHGRRLDRLSARHARHRHQPGRPDQSFSANGQENYFLPSLGYSHLITPDLGVGIAAYGNGGLNTSYGTNPYGRFGATGKAGVNLDQFFVSPTAAYQFAPGHSIGLSVNVAYQWFSAGRSLRAILPDAI
jgi:hypothetical protein